MTHIHDAILIDLRLKNLMLKNATMRFQRQSHRSFDIALKS
ncbi:hypothetical protein X745_12015 [Mesorhizobium sp. LNJC374B00]|nr:hypothetical protein X745_12015 [Mesorhizobium sp. LNJC374B00]